MNVTISHSASAKIKQMLEDNDVSHPGIRLMIIGGGCSGLSYDMDFESEEREGDLTSVQEGITLYVDPMSLQYIDGTSVDYIETFKYSGFNFENPNSKKSCGCGSSFSV